MIPTGVTRGRPNPLHQTFPLRLRRSRRAADLTLSGLVKAAGLSKNAGSMFEAGPRLPRVSTTEQMARVLGVSAAWLAFGLGEQVAPAEQGPLRCAGLSARAREARAALGLSVREVGRRGGTAEGLARSVENGTMPSLDMLELLAKALQVSPAWLAFGEGPRELPARRGKPAPAASGKPAP